MVNAVLGQALCIPAELAINNILKHDAATIAALGRHQGRLLGITIVGVANVTVRLLDNGIQLGMSKRPCGYRSHTQWQHERLYRPCSRRRQSERADQ